MIVSSSNNAALAGELNLTPAMVRGLFLIWHSELQREQQFAEIREFDDSKGLAGSFAGGAFGVDAEAVGYEPRPDRASGRNHLSDAHSW